MVFHVHTSVLGNSDGSAELTVGNTKVITSINGPIEPKGRQALPTMASLEIVIRPSVGVSTTREKLLEDKLRSLLQAVIVRYKYPNQHIQIVVQFLITDSTNGNEYTSKELDAAIQCCYFALIDANIYLNCSFASISLCLIDGKVITNPSYKQLLQSDSHHVVCFSIEDQKPQKVLLLESIGDFSESELFQVISSCADDCVEVHQQQRKVIGDKIEKDYIWK